MAMIRWTPLEEMSLLRNQLDRIFESSAGNSEKRSSKYSFPVEVTELPDAYVIRAMVPGIDPSQIKVESAPKELHLTAAIQPRELEKDEIIHMHEFHYGEFSRHFTFPQAIDMDNIEAEYDLGILRIKAPKVETLKTKAVEIKVQRK